MEAAKWTRMRKINLYNKQKGMCFYCGVRMILDASPLFEPRTCTIDHVLPKSKGGDDSPDNVVACCTECNNRKGNWYPGT